MDKKSFITRVDYDDKSLISYLYEKVVLTEKTGRPAFSNEFYPPILWQPILAAAQDLGVKVTTNGIFEEAERRMLGFSSIYDENMEDFPVVLLQLTNKSAFSHLEHKDYLGGVMSLGIKREKFGDLIVEGEKCYMAASKDIYEYVISNLTTIGRCPSEVEILDLKNVPTPVFQFESQVVMVPSLRVDCLVGELCHTSRSKATSLLESGKVFVNYMQTSEKDTIIKEGTVITIRGHGKYKLVEVVGTTQKGRLRTLIKKFI